MPQNPFRLYQNPDGPVLGTVSAPILEQDGLFFKDLARTGQLLPYEDCVCRPRPGRRISLPSEHRRDCRTDDVFAPSDDPHSAR